MKYILLLLIFCGFVAQGATIEGSKKVYLVDTAGELTHIANVEFSQNKNKTEYSLSIVDEPFENQFLSMRPFQCVMGNTQVMCHVPYPYKKKGYIVGTDFSDLSYDLLFLHKNPSEYGINMWNGIYYKLTQEGNEIEGQVFEVDMNILATPPDDKDQPFAEDEIFEADLTNYNYPRVLIK